MAVFNTEMYLRKCIQSLIDQTFSQWELICINDGSTDGSLLVLNEFADKDPRIQVYSQPNSGRHAVPFNKAVELAKGEFIFSLDSDDYISTDFLENAYNRIIETNADLCLPELLFIQVDGKESHRIGPYNNDYDIILSNKKAVELSLDWQIHGVGLWRASIIKEIKSDEDGFSVEYSARLRFLKCNKVVFSKGQYYYLQHPNATTKKLGLRQFYYIELDYKLVRLLRDNQFDNSVLVNFEWQRIARLIQTARLYYSKKQLLSKENIKTIKLLIKKSYNDIYISLCKEKLNELSLKKKLRYKALFLNFQIFKLYCYFKTNY
ncbi:MAG: glycosyltransferase [Paludibacter sp.]|nr:glycosyltransferase [Paludibacter sp.]